MEKTGISGDDRILSSYIDGLAARALGISQTIQPRVPALFEPIKAAPGLPDVGIADDRFAEVILSDDKTDPQHARNFSAGHALKNNSGIRSGNKQAIENSGPVRDIRDISESPSAKGPNALEYADEGGLRDHVVQFERPSEPAAFSRISSDIEQSLPGRALKRDAHENAGTKGERLDDAAAENANENANRNAVEYAAEDAAKGAVEDVTDDAAENARTFEPIIDGNIIDGMHGFKNGKDITDTSPDEVSPETIFRPVPEGSDEFFAAKYAKGRLPIQHGLADPEGNDIEAHSLEMGPYTHADGANKHKGHTDKVAKETTGEIREYVNIRLEKKLPDVASPKPDYTQAVADSNDRDATIKNPLIEDAFPGKLSSAKQSLIRNNAPQASEIAGLPAVKVTIGKIVVKAVLPSEKKVQRPAPQTRSSSLEKYLLSIRGGSR